jgi:hypothetical protein
VAAAGTAGPAAGRSLSGAGTLTYAFHGSAALGCAADDLCGVSGTLALDIRGGNDGPEIAKGPPVLLVAVRPALSTTDALAGTTCTDTPGFGGFGYGSFTLAEPHANGVTVEHPLIADGIPGGGRCAGPLERDLARLPITVARSGGADPSFALALGGATSSGAVDRAGQRYGPADAWTRRLPLDRLQPRRTPSRASPDL